MMKHGLAIIAMSVIASLTTLRTTVHGQEWVLRVSGDVKQTMAITGTEFSKLPRAEVTVHSANGKTTAFEGVSLLSLLQMAGAPLGDSTEKKNQTWYVQAEASDGYKVIFALPEIDTSFTKNTILVADKKNGGSLDTNAVPLMIVVPHEQRHARWIRHLTALRVLRSAE